MNEFTFGRNIFGQIIHLFCCLIIDRGIIGRESLPSIRNMHFILSKSFSAKKPVGQELSAMSLEHLIDHYIPLHRRGTVPDRMVPHSIGQVDVFLIACIT